MFFESYLYLIFWLAFCAFHGIYDASLYHIQDYSKTWKVNPHEFATQMRIAAALPLVWGNFAIGVMASIVLIFTFSFIHNGFYYWYRGELGADYKFWSTSKSSTAVIEMDFVTRTILFVGGITLYILYRHGV